MVMSVYTTEELIHQVLDYATHLSLLEFLGLFFGLLCVYFLIKQNILTWICGIIYVLISFVVFWQARLYGDFLLHIIFLVLNIYGWIEWTRNRSSNGKLSVSTLSLRDSFVTGACCLIGIILFAQLLIIGPNLIEGMKPASLPYWDSTTSILSVAGIWLTAKKKLENWYYWLIVDILATGIYYYKGIYFYSVLYFVYIGMAISGYLAWKKSLQIKA